MKKILFFMIFIVLLFLGNNIYANTPTFTPTIIPTATPTMTPVPKPYLWYMETPLGLDAIMPREYNVYGSMSGRNNTTTSYKWIWLTKDSENEHSFINWVYYIVENSPEPLTFTTVGNNTSSAYYDFIRPLIEE